MKYVWDQTKNRSNQKKHKITFEEAMTVLVKGDDAQIMDDMSEDTDLKQ